MIIRLIDIVLIVLFGFITISDIDIKAALSLPSKKPKSAAPIEKKEKVFLEVEIDRGDVFRIGRLGEKKTRIKGLSSLDVFLQNFRSNIIQTEGADIAVILRPMEMSPVQSTIDVLDLCSFYKIPKNIARKSMAIY